LRQKRRELKMLKLEARPWWPDCVALKDALSLRELSVRFGATPATIAGAFKRRNIERIPMPPGAREHRSPERKAAAATALGSLEATAAPAELASKPIQMEAQFAFLVVCQDGSECYTVATNIADASEKAFAKLGSMVQVTEIRLYGLAIRQIAA